MPDAHVTLDAALFDMDGLLVDTEPLWTLAEEDLARHLGRRWDPALKVQIVGTRIDAAVPTILRFYDLPLDAEVVADTTRHLLGRVAELFAGDLPLLPGAGELLATLARAGVPCALVSSSYRVLVDAVLSHGYGPFAVSLAGDEVERPKPDPQPYLAAARALGADPARCVVLEDSPVGVRSGLGAGALVVAVPSVAGVEVPDHPDVLQVPSLAVVSLDQLGELVAGRSSRRAGSRGSVSRWTGRPGQPAAASSTAAGTATASTTDASAKGSSEATDPSTSA